MTRREDASAVGPSTKWLSGLLMQCSGLVLVSFTRYFSGWLEFGHRFTFCSHSAGFTQLPLVNIWWPFPIKPWHILEIAVCVPEAVLWTHPPCTHTKCPVERPAERLWGTHAASKSEGHSWSPTIPVCWVHDAAGPGMRVRRAKQRSTGDQSEFSGGTWVLTHLSTHCSRCRSEWPSASQEQWTELNILMKSRLLAVLSQSETTWNFSYRFLQ